MGDYRITISSTLSFSRIILAVPAWYCITHDFSNSRMVALALILVAVATDYLDGSIARKLHQVTELGKIIDPIADKIAVAIVALALMMRGELELWFLVLILLRDFLILLGGIYIQRKKKIITQSNWPGKFAVSFVTITLALTLIQIPALNGLRSIILWTSVALMAGSFALYVQRLFIGVKMMKG
jgi:CDP-diacylglycerol--glycerol-3-phosphate 3-phosphatidyltransferase